VRVTLSDGTEEVFDLVIGADGPHSATRRLAFGPEDRFIRPLGGYMAWFTAPESASLDGWYQMLNAPGGLVASLRPGREAGSAKAALSFTSGPLAYDRHDLDAQHPVALDADLRVQLPQQGVDTVIHEAGHAMAHVVLQNRSHARPERLDHRIPGPGSLRATSRNHRVVGRAERPAGPLTSRRHSPSWAPGVRPTHRVRDDGFG
jgi:2-polyprenyl-6-methoxyphenol hydroxylase-like FAD-dependent oxidoreductase